jgi:hypothetical protein
VGQRPPDDEPRMMQRKFEDVVGGARLARVLTDSASALAGCARSTCRASAFSDWAATGATFTTDRRVVVAHDSAQPRTTGASATAIPTGAPGALG